MYFYRNTNFNKGSIHIVHMNNKKQTNPCRRAELRYKEGTNVRADEPSYGKKKGGTNGRADGCSVVTQLNKQ